VTTWLTTSSRTQVRVIEGLRRSLSAPGPSARPELLAIGETVRKRSVETTGELTPREAQITRLAWDGRANPEISTRLFVGRRAAEWHLRTVESSEPPGLRSFGHADPDRPRQFQRVRADLGSSSTDAPLLTRRSTWHPSWPPPASVTAFTRAGRPVHRRRRCMPRRLRAGRGRGPGPHLGRPSPPRWPAPWTRHRPGHRRRRQLGALTATPPSAVSHGPGLTGLAAREFECIAQAYVAHDRLSQMSATAIERQRSTDSKPGRGRRGWRGYARGLRRFGVGVPLMIRVGWDWSRGMCTRALPGTWACRPAGSCRASALWCS
jgi:hypothetical protein